MNAPWKTVRVFISSTFRDMQAERDWLVRFVFPLLREELLKYRIHFVDVDLRWGVTSDQDALGVCREVIDECQPLFMCVLGGRYGWVPDGNDKSITADEIHYGAVDLEAEERGHSFFYFREDNYSINLFSIFFLDYYYLHLHIYCNQSFLKLVLYLLQNLYLHHFFGCRVNLSLNIV